MCWKTGLYGLLYGGFPQQPWAFPTKNDQHLGWRLGVPTFQETPMSIQYVQRFIDEHFETGNVSSLNVPTHICTVERIIHLYLFHWRYVFLVFIYVFTKLFVCFLYMSICIYICVFMLSLIYSFFFRVIIDHDHPIVNQSIMFKITKKGMAFKL